MKSYQCRYEERTKVTGSNGAVLTDDLPEEMYKRIQPLLPGIDRLLCSKWDNITVAIEGRCASGKTTAAECLAKMYDCNVFHMDDFFLRPEQRTKERLERPGENVDHERFLTEVLIPLSKGEKVKYQKYDCAMQMLSTPIVVPHKKLNVIEGVYSFHPSLFDYYDMTVFLCLTEFEQRKRISKRNTQDMAEKYFNFWIPLEENYFSFFKIQSKATIVI